ncbi:MAG: MFS transporter [Burkholderiaceae bacterium]|nr:MFS transporter [Burkholderiaceae bacterium]
MPGIGQSLRYGLPGFTLAFAALPLYLLTPALYAQQFGLGIGLIGLLLMLTRLTDAIADPFIGRWIDTSKTQLWVWMSVALLVMAVGLALLTNPQLIAPTHAVGNEVRLALWLVACTLLVSLANSTATLAHQSWAVAWTADTTGQARLIGARELWALVGVISAAGIAGQQSGLGLGAVAVASGVLAVLLTFGLRGQGLRTAERRHHRLAWSALIAQPGFRKLLTALGINALANAIPPTLILFFLQDRLGASSNESSLLLASYFVAAAAGVPLWSWASHRFNTRYVWMAAMMVALLAFVWTLTLDHGALSAFTIICLVTGFALGAELVCPPMLLGRQIDRAHHRGSLEASYFGIWNLVIKLALAFAAGLTLPALAGMHYTPGDTSSANNLTALQWAYAGIPCVLKCFAIAALFTLSDHDEIPANQRKD